MFTIIMIIITSTAIIFIIITREKGKSVNIGYFDYMAV